VAKASVEESRKLLAANPEESEAVGLAEEIERFNRTIVSYPWTSLEELRARQDLVTKIRTCRDILEKMESALSKREVS